MLPEPKRIERAASIDRHKLRLRDSLLHISRNINILLSILFLFFLVRTLHTGKHARTRTVWRWSVALVGKRKIPSPIKKNKS